VALGCAKNRVDTERMLGLAQRLGLEGVDDAARADIIVVNTCGFILPAKEESIDALLELARHKRDGRCRTLVMAGCLAQRHPAELAVELPEVDHFIGTGDLARLGAILGGEEHARVAVGDPATARAAADGESRFERALGGAPHSAYLKIAEGCNRPCAFCVIPRLRGPQRSRSVASLVDEARALVARGARELNLVAQDTTAFGRDLDPPPHPSELLEALDALGARKEAPQARRARSGATEEGAQGGLHWLRLLYAYPSAVDARLIETMARLPRVVPYLDLPLQHIDDEVLRRMRRGYRGDDVRRTIAELRRAMPAIHLRATLIAGHPGESAAAQRALCAFLREAELDHVGVFAFSPEEGTDSATQPDQVAGELAAERAAELAEVQRTISRRKLRRLRGCALEVMVDGPSEESEYLLAARHAGQAPEVDGIVHLADCDAAPGTLLEAVVTSSADHDLAASPSPAPNRARRGARAR
jgi:ribosomal protein S12 methylthiotransferase